MCRVDLRGQIDYADAMGRDLGTTVTVDGKTGLARARLEHNAVILRGDLRRRITRNQLTGWHAIDDDLHLSTPQGPVILHLGDREAAAWARVLNKPAPRLAHKLGLTPATTVWLAHPVTDAALADALHLSPISPTARGATLGLALVMVAGDLDTVIATMAAHPALPVWLVYTKGPKAAFGDTAIRTALRAAMHAAALINTKVCAVSSDFSATRYGRRKG